MESMPYASYINFGKIKQKGPLDILHLRADTWYYASGDRLGSMDLGDGPVLISAGAWAFVFEQLDAFFQSSFGVFRATGTAELLYQGLRDHIRGDPRYRSLTLLPGRLEDDVSERLHPKSVIAGLRVPCDIHVALRTFEGEVEWQWLRAAEFTLSSEEVPGMKCSAGPDVAVWRATIWIDVLSLFKTNNAKEIEYVRTLWLDLRDKHPGMATFADVLQGDYNDLMCTSIITLVAPPPNTPPDNQELAKLNVPALYAAISRWELVTRRPFKWEESIDI